MRYSHQRQLVYDALKGTKTHPDANWVYAEVAKSMPHISLGTVYRNLNELADNGQIKRISAVGNVERYDADTRTHAHLICKCCGAIMDAEIADSDFVVDIGGFVSESAEIMIYGKCATCAKENI